MLSGRFGRDPASPLGRVDVGGTPSAAHARVPTRSVQKYTVRGSCGASNSTPNSRPTSPVRQRTWSPAPRELRRLEGDRCRNRSAAATRTWTGVDARHLVGSEALCDAPQDVVGGARGVYVAEREETLNLRLVSTARCCGRRRHRQPNSVRVCSPAIKAPRYARPPLRGADGLDAGSAHARSDWLLRDDAKSCPPYMLWSTTCPE